MKKLKISIVLSLVLSLFVPYIGAEALTFNNGYVLSDYDLLDYNSMNLNDIQKFLESKNGILATYKAPDDTGVVRTAAEIIYNEAQEHKISPKVILVMIQKEQSLVEDPTPTQKQLDWAIGYGVCDSCSMNDPKVLIFKGFGTQVDRAAGVHEWYIENKDQSWLKQAGHKYKIDGHNVYIQNQATANLYNYTPHILGNYNFWKIWNEWFTQNHPDGTLLKAEGLPGIWILENGEKRSFSSISALLSRYDMKNIVTVHKSELEKYETGKTIKFANYSLLKTPMGNSFLLVDDKLRKFESAEVVRTIGYNPEEFEDLTMEDFSDYELGEPITMASAYPVATLLQNEDTGGVYLVQDGKKAPLVSMDILNINFKNQPIIKVTAEELAKYEAIAPVILKDGNLVKEVDKPSVYVISQGKKRPIVSGQVFESLGYSWDNIIEVEPVSLAYSELGLVIDLDFKK